jgi:hypothetical protein
LVSPIFSHVKNDQENVKSGDGDNKMWKVAISKPGDGSRFYAVGKLFLSMLLLQCSCFKLWGSSFALHHADSQMI